MLRIRVARHMAQEASSVMMPAAFLIFVVIATASPIDAISRDNSHGHATSLGSRDLHEISAITDHTPGTGEIIYCVVAFLAVSILIACFGKSSREKTHFSIAKRDQFWRPSLTWSPSAVQVNALGVLALLAFER